MHMVTHFLVTFRHGVGLLVIPLWCCRVARLSTEVTREITQGKMAMMAPEDG